MPGKGSPFVPPSAKMAELTPRAVALGCVLGVILTAANTYLGLYTGLTVSSSIPAAVLSMAILRWAFRKGTILENNIVQTIAASGESLAAGIIFTVPALLITGMWSDVQFWPTTLICISGGLLGICFMIPLRKPYIVDDKTLAFPESLACSEVLKAGEKGGSGTRYVLLALALGAVFKFFTAGVTLFKSTVQWVGKAGSTPFYFGVDVSAALLAVGYIVGPNIGALSFIGGVLTWCIAIPLMIKDAPSEELVSWFWSTWKSEVRFAGVGAMVVGGLWSLFSIRKTVVGSFKEAIFGFRRKTQESTVRTEINMAPKHVSLLIATALLLTFGLSYSMLRSIPSTVVVTLSVFVMSFFFTAVSSYVSGLVGNSNSPISGMTICAVLATCGLLLLLGIRGAEGVLAALVVAGIVCCAACSAGDISQDLKTGYILGATPKHQQWMEVLGAAIPSIIITPILIVLHHSYGIGTDGPNALLAPQANLFAHLVEGIFGDRALPWRFVALGAGVGIVVVIIDNILAVKKSKVRAPIMAVAIGMYLPLTISATIFVGSMIAGFVHRRRETGKGVLFASGLIAGEALVGVLIAAVVYFNGARPISLVDSDIVSCAGFFIVGSVLYLVAKAKG